MSASEALNMPVEVKMAGKTYKVRELGLFKLRGYLEQYIRQQRIQTIQEIVAGLDADSVKAVIRSEIDAMPIGQALSDMAAKMMTEGNIPDSVGTEMLSAALQKDQPDMSSNEIATIIENADQKEINLVMSIVAGVAGKGRAPARKKSGK